MSASSSKSPSKPATNVPPNIRKKSRKKGISSDECHPDISIPAQASTTLRSQSVEHSFGDGVEGNPSKRRRVGDRDARSKEARDSRHSTSIAPSTIDQLTMEARNEGDHGIPNPIKMPFIPLERPSIGEDVQSREAGHGIDPDFPIPTEATTVAIEPCSRDGDLGSEEVPSITLFQGASNFQINKANFITSGRDATIIQFGDGQFTDVERNLICDYIANLTVLPDINDNLKRHVLTQSIILLPRAKAVFDDYKNKKKSGPCFKGTREVLLREMADWATGLGESRMYVLSGLAGIGKSTVAYTIASRAAELTLLGASFFFSRDEADRKNAEKFFSTIAYQLCVYNETFAKAIGDVLLTERGSAATTKDPQEQLQVLIVEPLRSILQSPRPILIVVDALDECDEEDGISVLTGLRQLVRDLPSFKVILTTRPQPYLDHFLRSQGGLQIFHLQNIEDRIVDGDIRLYLQHSLSLGEVQRHYPRRQWCACDEEIGTLVCAAGRLFIIASTAVRYIFDKSASNPAAQMQKLLSAFAQAYTPFKDLDHFYAVILRNVVPANCDDNDDIVDRYRSVVGAIIFVQRPLPVSTLAHLINIDVDDIHAVLDHLQSVILLDGDDVPRIYHKSFPDYLTDQARCKDPHLRIDPGIHHTQIATHCFEIMGKHLKYNILGLGDPARFIRNEDGLKEDGMTDEQLQEKIPQLLRYACEYWVHHLQANIEGAGLMNELEKFADEYILYWFEVLSLIGSLDSAHLAIRAVLKLLKSTSSDLHQLLSDALRFISKFYGIIERSALHTYYSALPFTPTDSLLYRRYIKETAHNICSIEGGPEKWDAHVAILSQGQDVSVIIFSLDSTLFVSSSEELETEDESDDNELDDTVLKIWDAATGTPISTISGAKFAVANDFSTVASSRDNIITLYHVNGGPSGTMFTTPSKIQKLSLSSESRRVAAALADGTVWLWDSGNAKLIDSFDGFGGNDNLHQLQFSATGTRLAYSSSSANGIKLRDGTSGRCIADLRCGSWHKFEFSGDGSRIASLSYDNGLTLWNSVSGGLIATVRDHDAGQDGLAISANGSLLATSNEDLKTVTLWSGTNDSLAQIKVLEVDGLGLLAFSLNHLLAIATYDGIKLYSVKTHSFISKPLFDEYPDALAFSPDCTRLAVGDGGNMNLWDIRRIDSSCPPSEEGTAVRALSLSRDCSRLACGFEDGTVELWETSPTKRRIASHHAHKERVRALGFGPDGGLFASGSDDGTTKLWNGKDGSLRGTLDAPTPPSALWAVALSNNVLIAGHDAHDDSSDDSSDVSDDDSNVTLLVWSLDPLSLIHTFEILGKISTMSIAENSTLIAIVGEVRDSSDHSEFTDRDRLSDKNVVSLLDVVNHTTIATFDVPPDDIHTMTFLPDNSQLVVQSNMGVFLSLNLVNKHIIKGPTLEHLIQLPNTPLWNGVPIWQCGDYDLEQHYFAASFSQDKSPVPVLWIPREIPVAAWTQGRSMIALGCEDGRVILLRLPTSHVS